MTTIYLYDVDAQEVNIPSDTIEVGKLGTMYETPYDVATMTKTILDTLNSGHPASVTLVYLFGKKYDLSQYIITEKPIGGAIPLFTTNDDLSNKSPKMVDDFSFYLMQSLKNILTPSKLGKHKRRTPKHKRRSIKRRTTKKH